MPDIQEEKYLDLTFPVAGLDVTTEYETPRPGTTQVGVNVRSFDPLTGRLRGGRRPGLTRFIDATVT